MIQNDPNIRELVGYGSQPPTHCLTREDSESPRIRMVYQRAFPMVDVYFDSFLVLC